MARTVQILSNAETRVAVIEEDGRVVYEVGAFILDAKAGVSVALAILSDAARRSGSLEATILHKLLGRSIAEMA